MEYPLNFTDALASLFDGKFVVGENFANGIFLRINRGLGHVELCDCNDYYRSWPLQITRGVVNQHYKTITVANKSTLTREPQ